MNGPDHLGFFTEWFFERKATKMQWWRRDCHFDDTPFLSLLKHLLKVCVGGQQNDRLADGAN